MSDYVKSTNFAIKDSLVTTDPAKVIKGTDLDNEFNALANAIASKANTNSPSLTGTPTAPTATTGSNTTQVATTAYVKQEITALGTIGTMAAQNKNSVDITGGTVVGITDLAVADGGTGASTLTGVVIGNGTSAMTAVAPGTSGNVLKSNGSAWTSAAPTVVKGLGLGGETWHNVTSSRSFNTQYTNSYSYPIMVSATTNDSGPSPGVRVYVDGVQVALWYWQFNGAGARGGGNTIVPPGSTYQLDSINGAGVNNWAELY